MKSASAARKTSRFLVAFVMALTGLASIMAQSCSQPASETPAADAAPLTVTPIDSPAGPASSEPNLTVQGDRLFLSWIESDEDQSTLRFAERTATGWTPAQDIRSSAQLNVNAEDIPSVQLLADGTLVAAWTDKNGPNPEASTLRLSFSTDEGKTWSAPASPYRDRSETQHGFVSLFQAPGAGLGLVWLDGRALAGKEDGQGDMALRSAVYDPAGKQLKESVVDPRACECCSTSAAATSEGIIVAYRDRSPEEIRDIYVTTFDGADWSAPVRVHADNWMINGCPVNGPAVSARGRDVAVAWFTAQDIQGQAFVAFSHDAGKTFGPAVRIDGGRSLGHVGVQLLADGSAAVSNMELVDSGGQFRARKVSAAGVPSPIVNVAGSGDPDTRSPRLAGNARELLFAWTESDENYIEHVHVASAALAAN